MMQMQNDRELRIALGTGRKTKKWKNKTMQWSELLERLGQFVVTNETVAEYKAMARDRQAEIKDVGAFVGGYCKDGNRKNVVSRSVLCLDADYADSDLWPDVQLLFDCAAAVYSTHKHTPEAPRVRLVIPLARDVTPDEYVAIGRRVAADLGIDKFDDTTYQAQRLMYWPSRSKDGEELFRYQDGPMLDPDKVLARYDDWRDISTWPVSSRVAEVVQKTAAKQKDPLTKPGLVGAFCRTYSIQEAIERFLPDVYLPCDDPGRYTYAGGSTAAGVVVYDDRFVYSHHATDPASAQLCNAWDAVRLHLFAGMDDDKDPDTPVTKLPSYKAMEALAMKDEAVRVAVVNERMGDIEGDFEDLGDDDPDAWKKELELTGEGGIRSTIGNIRLILEHDPALRGCIAWDEMDMMQAVKRDLPWREASDRRGRTWQNSDDANLRLYLEKTYGITGREKILDGVETTARAHSFHPIREYIRSAEWDGTPRVETLLIRYLGAEDTEYTRTVTRKTLTAAVARVFQPGIKFDYMLTIRGRQGIRKSSLIEHLAGDWFSDSFGNMSGKEAYEQVRRAWIIEVGELAGMKKAEVETIKLFITKREDQYRPAYGRTIEIYPRQCIFIGTTNEAEFLRDPTGNRRFWVVDTPNSDKRVDFRDELTEATVAQIWAEAYHYYKQGETLYLPDDIEAEAAKIQADHAETDDRVGMVQEYLDRLLPEDWEEKDLFERREWLQSSAQGTKPRDKVSRLEIWCEVFGNQPGKIDRYEGKAIHAMLEACGWRYTTARQFGQYGRQRAYVKS